MVFTCAAYAYASGNETNMTESVVSRGFSAQDIRITTRRGKPTSAYINITRQCENNCLYLYFVNGLYLITNALMEIIIFLYDFIKLKLVLYTIFYHWLDKLIELPSNFLAEIKFEQIISK